jgi:hypothetical protein
LRTLPETRSRFQRKKPDGDDQRQEKTGKKKGGPEAAFPDPLAV